MTVNKPKGFREQFIECEVKGFHKTHKFFSFEHHPEMLPFCPTKRKKFLESGEKGIQLITCGRFGGTCSSGHSGCQKLRGLI